MSRVWLRMAGTSEATKYSPSPRPTTTGGPERAATILSGSLREMTLSANTPVSCSHRVAHGVFQIAVEIFLDQVRDHFGIGLGAEAWPSSMKLVLERQIILDDAVVHHHDVAVAIAMRMRVFLGGPAVRGPARVADAVGALDRIQPQRVFQVAQLARRGAPRGTSPSSSTASRPNRSRGTPAASGRPE